MVAINKSKAIFFDRDGVLVTSIIKNRKPFAVKKVADFKIYKNASNLINKVVNKGYKIFIITNQPDVEKSSITLKVLNKMHKKLSKKIKVDKIFTCIHKPETNCKCRKPSPFMIKKATKIYNINLKKSFVIGDRKSDIESGFKAGCKTIFIDRNYKEKKPSKQNYTVKNLSSAIRCIENDEIR